MDPHFASLIAEAVERTATRIRREFEQRPPVAKTWLKTSEAAQYLSCDVDWLEKLRREGNGPRFKKRGDRFIRYNVADLDAWMAAGDGGSNG